MNVTREFDMWKEATRNLWNLYFVKNGKSDWESHEIFQEIEKALFEQIVLKNIGINRSIELKGTFKLLARSNNVIPVMVNRTGESGYWDHPITSLINDVVDIKFIEYFDWDQLGIRDNRYMMSRILSSRLHPEINGFKAIIESHYVDVVYEKTA